MWTALLGAGLELANNAISYDQQKALDRDERRYQSLEAEKAYGRQVDFWNKQNEYNTPANQRKRLEDAGYNILDLMRNGSAMQAAGGLSNVNSPGAGRGSNAPAAAMGGSFADLALTQSQRRLNEQNATLAHQRALGEELENVRRQIEILEQKDTREARVRLDAYYQREKYILESMGLSNKNAQKDLEVKDTQMAVARAEEALKISQEQLVKAQEQEAQDRAALEREKINTEKAIQSLHKMSAYEMRERVKTYASKIQLNEAQADQLEDLAEKLRTDKDYRSFILESMKKYGQNPEAGGQTGTLERFSLYLARRLAGEV